MPSMTAQEEAMAAIAQDAVKTGLIDIRVDKEAKVILSDKSLQGISDIIDKKITEHNKYLLARFRENQNEMVSALSTNLETTKLLSDTLLANSNHLRELTRFTKNLGDLLVQMHKEFRS